jgi:hypothetical protein
MLRSKNTNSPITRDQLLEHLKAHARMRRIIEENRLKFLEASTARALRGNKIIFKIGDWKPAKIKVGRQMPIAMIEDLKKRLTEVIERRCIRG